MLSPLVLEQVQCWYVGRISAFHVGERESEQDYGSFAEKVGLVK